VTVRVDCGAPQGPLRRIWTSLGFDEINWTSTPAGKRHLRTIAAFAERPYYVRSHYIFNSGIGWSLPHWGAGNVYHEDASGRHFYDFAIADQVYDAVVHAGHQPLVEHCVGRYGAEHVRGWLWELWNEPDILYWRGSPEQFHALYDVTAAAVKAALPGASVGGPATTGDLDPGRRGNEFLRGFLAHCARRRTPLDFVSFHTKGARFTPWRVYGPLGGPAPTRQSPSSLKMLREVRAALDAVSAHPEFRDLPCIVDECDASVPAHWGIYDNANFAYRNTEYFAVFQCKLMKKLLDLDARGARVHQATTWSFYFEGERFFEGTRSLFTAAGIEKPVLNAYRMLGRLGDTRLAAESTRAWPLDRLDAGEAGMPEEIDALAAAGPERVGVVVWRHADDQYASEAPAADVTLRIERLPFRGQVAVTHWRIDAAHSNSHAAWRAQGEPQDPTEAQLHAIRERQGLERVAPDRIETVCDGALTLGLLLPLPSASLIEIQPAS